ncbi:MAG: transporter substrate-binding domain-containing protein [Synergistaceae bacterium]|nr:transporter substrate-binding domain-containing protein [Synergistaceae bacterium]
MKQTKKWSFSALLMYALVIGAVFATSARAEGARRIQVAIKPDLYPISYIDDGGNPVGYDIEIARLIDEKLPGYEFEFVPLSQEAILVGVETGKYPVAISGFSKSPEREEKYLYPSENIGVVAFGLVVRTVDAGIDSFEKLADSPGLKIQPVPPATSMQIIYDSYNKEHPGKTIPYALGEWPNSADTLKWIVEGRYDVALVGINEYPKLVGELGYEGKLKFNVVRTITTWSLFNKGEGEFAEAYASALREIKGTGLPSELSIKYFGEDLFKYLK